MPRKNRFDVSISLVKPEIKQQIKEMASYSGLAPSFIVAAFLNRDVLATVLQVHKRMIVADALDLRAQSIHRSTSAGGRKTKELRQCTTAVPASIPVSTPPTRLTSPRLVRFGAMKVRRP